MSTPPILTEIQSALGDAWQRITPEQREAIEQSAKSIARMTLRASLGERISERSKKHIAAQLANLEAVTQLHLRNTIREVIRRVLQSSASLVADLLTRES